MPRRDRTLELAYEKGLPRSRRIPQISGNHLMGSWGEFEYEGIRFGKVVSGTCEPPLLHVYRDLTSLEKTNVCAWLDEFTKDFQKKHGWDNSPRSLLKDQFYGINWLLGIYDLGEEKRRHIYSVWRKYQIETLAAVIKALDIADNAVWNRYMKLREEHEMLSKRLTVFQTEHDELLRKRRFGKLQFLYDPLMSIYMTLLNFELSDYKIGLALEDLMLRRLDIDLEFSGDRFIKVAKHAVDYGLR